MKKYDLITTTKTANGERKTRKQVSYLIDYHPWHDGNNPNFDKNSSMILDFKKGKQSTIQYFAIMINNDFNMDWDNFCCVAAPSSDLTKTNTPVHELIRQLVSLRHGLQDCSGVLIRTKGKDCTKGWNRSILKHLNSIAINRNSSVDIYGKNVLLFDDVITTGNTIRACVQKLLDGGAKKVAVLTLARTVLEK